MAVEVFVGLCRVVYGFLALHRLIYSVELWKAGTWLNYINIGMQCGHTPSLINILTLLSLKAKGKPNLNSQYYKLLTSLNWLL